MLWIGLAILLYERALFGFLNLGGFNSSTTVHGFLVSWLFMGFLRDGKFWWEIVILVWFNGLDCFCYFCLMNVHFMDFLNLGNSIEQPWCMNF